MAKEEGMSVGFGAWLRANHVDIPRLRTSRDGGGSSYRSKQSTGMKGFSQKVGDKDSLAMVTNMASSAKGPSAKTTPGVKIVGGTPPTSGHVITHLTEIVVGEEGQKRKGKGKLFNQGLSTKVGESTSVLSSVKGGTRAIDSSLKVAAVENLPLILSSTDLNGQAVGEIEDLTLGEEVMAGIEVEQSREVEGEPVPIQGLNRKWKQTASGGP